MARMYVVHTGIRRIIAEVVADPVITIAEIEADPARALATEGMYTDPTEPARRLANRECTVMSPQELAQEPDCVEMVAAWDRGDDAAYEQSVWDFGREAMAAEAQWERRTEGMTPEQISRWFQGR